MPSDGELSFGWEQADTNDDTDIEDNNGKDDTITNGHVNRVVIKKEPNLSPVLHNSTRIDLNASNVSITNSSFHNQTFDVFNQSSGHRMVLNNTQNDDLSSFHTQHPRLTNVAITDVDNIGDNDEIWLVQCPYTVNLSTLVGLPILKNEKKRIKIPSSKFECVKVDDNQSQSLNIVMPPTKKNDYCKFTSHTIKGKFVIREKLESRIEIAIEEEPKTCVPFPTNLKRRHPLFGIDYKKMIKLPSNVREKLLNPSPKKKSKCKNNNSGDEFKYEVVEKVVKQAKKRKAEVLEELAESNKNMWESEQSIEKCLFAYPAKKKRKHE